MIESRFYPIYQGAGWSLLYAVIIGSLYFNPAFTPLEFLFAFVLIMSAACYSHFMRVGFKRWLKAKSLVLQILYFAFNAAVGASMAGCLLFVSVYLLSRLGVLDPFVPGQLHFVFQQVFIGNAFNMLIALIMWSAFYLIITKARQLRDTGEALASSQLATLAQQLNPHFLFNMLNNIRALILENPERARDSLARLADMLRYSLQSHESSEVSVAQELNMVNEYIELCKIQFEDRLQLDVQVPAALERALMPRMILQLCVENAIKHGIAKRTEGGCISIRMRELEGQWYEIFVENPCPIQEASENAKERSSMHIGLKNIRERLSLLYGSAELQLSFKDIPHADYRIATTYLSLPLRCALEEGGLA
ncbi:MAG: two component signal transduction system histidine kinase [Idiomarinaceae bacterium HL-53]|nr:MAG: two component signal transduction system histidine kinase [Idiomarinaceae bacterium HL-53]CUS48161.1 Histidine kinase [Idiomarinaceae bacterium HL-53]